MSDPALLIPARTRSIGDFDVGRVLPAPVRKSVGPFVFFDHFGPVALPAGKGMDVRPHPHIHLATLTWLFDGAIHHRDSLGTSVEIRPGAVNWMSAGRGIVHSERSPPPERAAGPRLHGLQVWIALPTSREDTAPSFSHHPPHALPTFGERGVQGTLIAGRAFGHGSPVPVVSPIFYAEVRLAAGARLESPTEYAERAVYVIEGDLAIGSARVAPRTMAVLRPGEAILAAESDARFVVLGGEPLDGPRYLWWNFVSSDKERIVEAARAWRAGRFPTVPGDEVEFIPLESEPAFL